MSNVLIVKHLPKKLTPEQRSEFLVHFGAKNVKCMNDSGKLKYTAFAIFENHDAATAALRQLHQLEFFGQLLSVEYSKKQHEKHHPLLLKDPPFTGDKPPESEKDEKTDKIQFPGELHHIAAKLGVNFPPNPKYEYMYPPPTVSILTNIANALASVPKFYVQVLNLMNKMNLPVPFGSITATPPIEIGENNQPSVTNQVVVPEASLQQEEMEMSSTEESELESEGEEAGIDKSKLQNPVKRPAKNKKQNVKRFKIQPPLPPKEINPDDVTRPEDVFENVNAQNQRKNFEFKLTEIGTGKIQSDSVPVNNGNSHDSAVNSSENIVIEDGGFGKIEPVLKETCDNSESDEESDGEPSEYISSSELKRHRLSESERRKLNVFKKYDPGEASSRLYIKNINHKKVDDKDLKRIFGRYVNWKDESQVNMFDLRLMKEGRMKGQAFVTLPSEKMARKAVYETNGFVIEDKPLVVQFARSAKPKEDESKK